MEEHLKKIDIDLVERGRYQPRRHFDAERLQELAESISSQGLVQPVVVRPLDGGRYELVAGERRWRAAQLAGLHRIDAVVREIDDTQMASQALIENIQREDLNPIEEAEAVRRLMDEHQYTQEEVGRELGTSRSAIANKLRLLNLADEVREYVRSGQLSENAGKVLAGRDRSTQTTLARQALRFGWSVRTIEARAGRAGWGESKSGAERDTPEQRQCQHLAEGLGRHLGSPVTIKHKPADGSYSIEIRAHSTDILEGVFQRMGFDPESD